VSLESISFQTTLDKIRAIEAVAKGQRRSPDTVLNEAIDIYLGLQSHHQTLIENGIRDADSGRLVSQAIVREQSIIWCQIQ
jgi:predicted transcriptional regulator